MAITLKSLKVENFRGIAYLGIHFESDTTVLIGKNGAGKTSALDLIAYLVTPVLGLFDQERDSGPWPPVKLGESDLRIGAKETLSSLNISLQDVSGKSVEVQTQIGYPIARKQSPSQESHNALSRISKKYEFDSDNRPIVVYYRQNRGFCGQEGGESEVNNKRSLQRRSILPDMKAISDLQSWWDMRDADEARKVRDEDQSYRDPQLNAIRRVVKEIEGFEGIRYFNTKEPSGLYFRKSGGVEVHINSLSSGERSFIILLADLARRLQVMAPEKSIEETRGVVLIDEIELNLHPSWQNRIMPTLSKIFKNCQFIATTHSPLVVSGVESRKIRGIEVLPDGKVEVDIPRSSKGRTANYILEGIMSSTDRSLEVQTLIDDFNRSVDAEDVVQAESMLKHIEASIDGDAPEIILMRKRLNRLKG